MFSGWEFVAVVLAVAYLLLAIRESVWCWPAGIVSSAIYLVLMARAALYMESSLQVFYIAVSGYGWWRWGRATAQGLRIRTWSIRQHCAALFAIGMVTVLNGKLLALWTAAALPYVDAFVTWSSILTTWMVAQKILENWLYWFVIDSISVYVYLQRGLPLTAALFGLYLVMIIAGFRRWRRHQLAQA